MRRPRPGPTTWWRVRGPLPRRLVRQAGVGRRHDPGGCGEEGLVSAFVAVIVPALLLCAALVLDGGLALAGKVRALDEAQEAARAGAQQLDLAAYRADGSVTLVPDRAAAAAHAYLASTGDTGSVAVRADTVTVRVTHVQHTQMLALVGVATVTVTSRATARAAQGVDGGAP